MSESGSTDTPALVVGIGGSAGALEGVEAVLSSIPAGTGLAFAVLLHAPPESASRLAEILARQTAIDVRVGGVRDVAPDRVVVVPSVREPGAPARGIDTMLAELAHDRGASCVALILSGTGTDGITGARAVEDAGGKVLVEAPASAAYPQMPEAVAAGCRSAEIVPSDLLGERLLDVVAEAGSPLGERRSTAIEEDIREILRLVRVRTSNDFSGYKPSTVIRRLERRMKAHGVASVGEYRALVERDEDEAEALAHDFAISVTSFFRDPEAFEHLRSTVIPSLLRERPPTSPIRVWDACCATGEEAYTIAMLLAERLEATAGAAPPQIFATDFDEEGISFARAGRYPKALAQSVGSERLARFFTMVDGDYQVKKELRDLIVFARHNLLHDPPFSRLDLIVCRNFLIYLAPEVQARILEMFHAMLRPGGYLFLGSSETLGALAERFEPVDKRWRIFRRDHEQSGRKRPYPGIDRTLFGGTRPQPPHASQVVSPTQRAERRLLDRFAPAFVVLNESFDVLHFSPGARDVCSVPAGEPTKNVMQLVRPGLRPAVHAALHKALQSGEPMSFRAHLDDEPAVVFDVTAERLDDSHPRGPMLLLFERVKVPHSDEPTPSKRLDGDEKDQLIGQLEEQLRLSQEELSATIEQLATSNDSLVSTNEELMSVNEEFQSANEELETSREELQTLNEELTTVNHELQRKVEALDRANNDITNLLDSTEIATLFLDRALRVKRFTPKAGPLFNLLPTDIGRPLAHLRSGIDYDRVMDDAGAVLSDEKPIEREVSTGDSRHYLMRLLPYRRGHSIVDGVVLTFIDLTERRRMEEELRERSRVLDLAHVLVRDLESRIVLWNSGSSALYGFSRDEAVGKVSHDLLRTTFPTPRAEIEATLFRDGSWEGELLHRAKDGSPIAVHSRWVLYRDSTGAPKRILETNADISARRLAEGRLRESERLVRTILDRVDEGFLALDREGKVLVVNRPLLALGPKVLAEAEVVGRRLGEIDCGPWLCMGSPAAALARRAFESHAVGEARERRASSSGRERSHELRAVPLLDDDGEVHSVLVTISDVTDRHELEEQRLRAQKLEAIGTLAGGIAHDFNNLLQGIIGYIIVARQELQRGEDAVGTLTQAEEAIAMASGLASQLLAFAKGGKPAKRHVSLARIVDATSKLAVSGSRVELDLKVADDLAGVEGDETQLAQVVQNLVMNAVQSMPNGGVVHVSARNVDASVAKGPREGRHVAIAVRDGGTGIATADLPRIFDPYFTTREAGSGLGLATVHAIVRNHDGRIAVKSAPGEGTTFTVYLPAERQVVSRPEVGAAEREIFGRVLVMDDNLAIRQTADRLLNALGHEAQTAPEGASAVAEYRRALGAGTPYNVVILDLTVRGGIGGEATLQQLRAVDPDVCAIVSSGYGGNDVVTNYLTHGFIGTLSKPYTTAELCAVVNAAIAERRRRRARA